ncbi:MAG: dihydrofolate reductase [Bulleidia sp.]
MIRMIAAVSKNNVIGKNGSMPWMIKQELAQFRRLTSGSTVIMGRKTYQSIGKPLPERMNIVISNTVEIREHNCITVHTLSEALACCDPDRDIWIIGGSTLYHSAMDLCDEIFISEIDVIVEDGDTWFPLIDENRFTVETGPWQNASIPFRLKRYTRKK